MLNIVELCGENPQFTRYKILEKNYNRLTVNIKSVIKTILID